MIHIKAIREAAEKIQTVDGFAEPEKFDYLFHQYGIETRPEVMLTLCDEIDRLTDLLGKANALCRIRADEIDRLHLPDDWYPESKDWRESPGDRGLWLRTMYEQAKEEIERLQEDAARYQWLVEYFVSDRTDLDDALVDASDLGVEQVTAVIDEAMEAKT